MHIQIELTTKCNYECFYCAGRDMKQRHMKMELFQELIDKLPPGGHRISLQGEGEPTMYSNFWDMVAIVAGLGHTPYTITNGSLLNPDKVVEFFPRIGISIDTVDPEEAQRIGRYKPDKMLGKLQSLLKVYAPHKVIVHTVDYGQDLAPLKNYLARLGITKHVVQPLQTKDDYTYLYADQVRKPRSPITYRCSFVDKPIMRFYNLDGIELPCCYIKNTKDCASSAALKALLDDGIVPRACAGCAEHHEGVELSRLFVV